MADDNNVISLDDRRRKSNEIGAEETGANPASTGGEDASQSSGKSGEAGVNPLPGRLIWLHCSTCQTLEYTEVSMPGGRVHNACGNQVLEVAVDLDLRAEHTIAEVNLERLNILEDLLNGQRKRFEEYKKRLTLAAGKSLSGYPQDDATLQKLPVAGVDAFGLLISDFFQEPMGRFPDAGADPNQEDAGDPAGDPSGDATD